MHNLMKTPKWYTDVLDTMTKETLFELKKRTKTPPLPLNEDLLPQTFLSYH